MSHTDIIWILVTASFASTFGVYVVIRKTIHYTRPPVNTLHRRNDIELQEVIDPIQHINVRDIDLSSLPQYPQVMVNNPLPIRWDHPPRYSQLTNNFINSPLELNSWDFIHWLIFLSILIAFIIIIFRYLNPSQIQFKIIIKLSIYVIYFILWYNTGNSTFITALIIPVSIDKISYNVDDTFYFDSNLIEINLYLWNKDEIEDLLKNELSKNETYTVTMEFVPFKDDGGPCLILSRPFLINKYSSSTTIEKFVIERLEYMIDKYYLDDSILDMNTNKETSPYIKLRIEEYNHF